MTCLSELGQAALDLAAAGFHILPLRPREKAPDLPSGAVLASSDPRQIVAWWTDRPDRNIGVACGPETGLMVLDFDDQWEALEMVEDRFGHLPDTAIAHTSRGMHYYFRTPEIVANVRIAPNTDLKVSGYVLAPPSIHPSGKEYFWDVAPWDSPIAPCPQWLENGMAKARRNATKTRRDGTAPCSLTQAQADALVLRWGDLIRMKGRQLLRYHLAKCNSGFARHDEAIKLAIRLRANLCPRDLAEFFMEQFRSEVGGMKSRRMGAGEIRGALEFAWSKDCGAPDNDLIVSIHRKATAPHGTN